MSQRLRPLMPLVTRWTQSSHPIWSLLKRNRRKKSGGKMRRIEKTRAKEEDATETKEEVNEKKDERKEESSDKKE